VWGLGLGLRAPRGGSQVLGFEAQSLGFRILEQEFRV
jgi:hypothetical protein